MTEKEFYLLQVNDALFPIGGYSHSQGLETYIQKGIVHDQESAAAYLKYKIRWGIAYTDLLAASLAFRRAKSNDLDGLLELEAVLSASRLPQEQREASQKLGSRFAKTIGQLDAPLDRIFTAYLAHRQRKPISHCCVYGVFCAALGISHETALAHYLYAQTSAMVTNCVKAIPLSQSAGQVLLCGCYPLFQELLAAVPKWGEDTLCLSTPGFDLRGMQHERLYSRLYMS